MATYVDIGLAVAEADPSMGWITTFYMEHNWLLTMFAEDLQDEIFGAQPFVLAPGSVNPSGRADPAPATARYSLSGHWTFGTGICHADWVLVSGKIEGDETGRGPQLPAAGRRRRGQGHVARRRHGGDREPRHRGHRRRRARAAGVADAAAPRVRQAGRSLPAPHPDPAVPLAHRRHARGGRGQASPRAVRGPPVRPGDVRHQADPERPGADAGAPGQPARRGRLRRDAAARRRRPHAGPRRRSRSTSTCWASCTCASASRTSSAGAATWCARSCSRAARRCTTSTTSCSASTATST